MRQILAVGLMLLLGASSAAAQVRMRVIMRNPAPAQLSVWQTDPTVAQVEINNQGATLESVRLSGEIRSSDGRIVASTNDADRSIPRFRLLGDGKITRLRGRDILNTSAVQVDKAISKMAAQTNSLPEGDYVFCLRLLTDNGEEVDDAEVACGDVSIVIADPPQLILPSEDQPAEVAALQFQWTPVLRSNVGGSVEYELTVVPILGTEAPSVAILKNEQLLSKRVQRTNYLLTRADRPLTANGARRFAWRVRAVTTDGRPCTSNDGYSEIGTFRLADAVVTSDAGKRTLPDTIIIRDTRIAVTSWAPKGADGTYSGRGCMVIKCDRRTRKPVSLSNDEKSFTRRKGFNTQTFTIRENVEDSAKDISTKEISAKKVSPLGGTNQFNNDAVTKAIQDVANQSKNCFDVQLSGITWEGASSKSVQAKGLVRFVATDESSVVPVLYPADSFVVEVDTLTLNDTSGFAVSGTLYHTSALIEDGTGELARFPITWKSTSGGFCQIQGWQQPPTSAMWIGETGVSFTVPVQYYVDLTDAAYPTVKFDRIVTRGVQDNAIRSNVGFLMQELVSSDCILNKFGIRMTANGSQSRFKYQLTSTPRGHGISYNQLLLEFDRNVLTRGTAAVTLYPDSLHWYYDYAGASGWSGDANSTVIDSLYTLYVPGAQGNRTDPFHIGTRIKSGAARVFFKEPKPSVHTIAARYIATAAYPIENLEVENARSLRQILETKNLAGMLIYDAATPSITVERSSDNNEITFEEKQFRGGFLYLGPGGLTSRTRYDGYGKDSTPIELQLGRLGKSTSRSTIRFLSQLPDRSKDRKQPEAEHYFGFNQDVADSILLASRIVLPSPLSMRFAAPDVSFTSLIEFPASPISLDTGTTNKNPWQLDIVPRDQSQPDMGYVSFDRGVINLTQSGFWEKVHFEKPFYIQLAEFLADGVPGSFIVDQNSQGQKFDGLAYFSDTMRLSPLPAPAGTFEYLETMGHVGIPFYGAKYMHIIDARDTVTYRPRLKRFVTVRESRGSRNVGSDLEWDKRASLGRLTFDMKYNVDGQDGFVGSGSVTIARLPVLSPTTLVVNRYGTCFHTEGLNLDVRDFLESQALVTSLDKAWACGCVEEDQFSSIAIGGQGASGYSFTPLIASAYGANEVTIGIHHDLVTIWHSGSIQINGPLNAHDARMLLRAVKDRRTQSVRGTVNLDFNASSAVGGFTVSSELDVFSGNERESQINIAYFQGKGKVTTELSSWVSGMSSKTEGGIFLGVNVPKSRAWILSATDSRFKLRDDFLTDKVTGMYVYGLCSRGVEEFTCEGRIDIFAGVGIINSNMTANAGVDIHGSLFSGLLYGSALANLQLALGDQAGAYGRATFMGCYNTFFWGRSCADFDIGVGLTRAKGFYVE